MAQQLVLWPFQVVWLKCKLRRHIYGKKILLVGSAPVANLSNVGDDYIRVAVNGSAANIKNIASGNHEPVLTILDSELVSFPTNRTKESRRVIIERGILKNLSLGTLVVSMSNNSPVNDIGSLDANYAGVVVLGRFASRYIIDRVTGCNCFDRIPNSILSRGVFSICLLLYLGAREVRFEGFTLFNSEDSEYFYGNIARSSAESIVAVSAFKPLRNHTMADCACLSMLALKGHKIGTSSVHFDHLLTNWIH